MNGVYTCKDYTININIALIYIIAIIDITDIIIAIIISDDHTLSFAEKINKIVWHNWNKRGFPSENDTSYFRLYHYYKYYVTIKKNPSLMYSTIRFGTASKATPQGRHLYRAGVGVELACILDTYTCIYYWYSMYLLFSGFCGTLWPPAPPIHGLEDNVPDVHDEGDFDVPYTQAALERFMAHMSKLDDVEYQVNLT